MNEVIEHLLAAVTHTVGALKHISATGTVHGVESAVAAADLRLTAAMGEYQKLKATAEEAAPVLEAVAGTVDMAVHHGDEPPAMASAEEHQ